MGLHSWFSAKYMYVTQILTPLQHARSIIEAYPYMQDVFAVIEIIAAEVRRSTCIILL